MYRRLRAAVYSVVPGGGLRFVIRGCDEKYDELGRMHGEMNHILAPKVSGFVQNILEIHYEKLVRECHAYMRAESCPRVGREIDTGSAL